MPAEGQEGVAVPHFREARSAHTGATVATAAVETWGIRPAEMLVLGGTPATETRL